ncbi:hypothetical protein Hdeb2414_s0013g00418621 [Helianthus debilis subsp. tardiflorus]
MGRKGKEIAGSSSQPAESQPKKRRYLGRDEDSDEEEEFELDPVDKPEWEAGPLDDQPIEWKPTLFSDRMNRLKDKEVAFICEREVREVEFGLFNVFARFRALGWEAALNCYDKDNKNLFKDEIQEWMATLKCNKYSKPSQMKLTSTVNGIEVEMSFDMLRKLAKYEICPCVIIRFRVLTICFSSRKPTQDGTTCWRHCFYRTLIMARFLEGTEN